MKDKIKQYAAINDMEEAEVYLLLLPIVFTVLGLLSVALFLQSIVIPSILIAVSFVVYLLIQASTAVIESIQMLFEIVITPKEAQVWES